MEQIEGISNAVPDIIVTKKENGIINVYLGEVKAGDNVITSNFNSQSLRYFNEVDDIQKLRFFRRDDVALTKQQVIDSWKNGGVMDNSKVKTLFLKYDRDVINSGFDVDLDDFEIFLNEYDQWFNMIFNSTF